jgi:hypothetical protein
MCWFVNRRQVEREAALRLLNSIGSRLPEITAPIRVAQSDALLEDIGQRLVQIMLSDRATMTRLSDALRHAREEQERLQHRVEELLNIQPHEDLRKLRTEAERMRLQIARAEASASRAHQMLESEQRRHATEVIRLQADIASLNRIVAEQETRLLAASGGKP